jgi:hypothetical protein
VTSVFRKRPRKGKVKLPLCLTNQALRHEGIWRSGCIDSCFLGLGTSWRWMVSFMPCHFTLGERTLVFVGWVGPRAELEIWRNENSWPNWDSNSRCLGQPAHSQSLYWLSYPSSGHVKCWSLSCFLADTVVSSSRLTLTLKTVATACNVSSNAGKHLTSYTAYSKSHTLNSSNVSLKHEPLKKQQTAKVSQSLILDL